MAKRRVAAVLVAAGSVAGAAALWRRRAGAGRERVDVFFADGSSITFAAGSEDAERLLPIARGILVNARR